MVDQALLAKLNLSPVGEAAYLADLDLLNRLLDEGADLAVPVDPSGGRALHWASTAEAARLLLDRGADMNALDGDHRTALYWHASKPDRAPILALLCERGADPTIASSTGVSPLHRAAEAGALDNASVLLRAGAFLDAETGDRSTFPGRTPLFHAVTRNDLAMARLLLDAGADVNHQDRARARFTDEGEQSPLHLAAEQGSLPLVELLLERGANRQLMNWDARTPADVAERAGHAACASRLWGP